MDGHFVPNISFGSVVMKSLRPKTDLIFDVHLMIENPDLYIDEFAEAGADIITIHAEATKHVHRSIQKIIETGKKAGIAINPGTHLTNIIEVLEMVDLVLIMSVNPGFGGQKMIGNCIDKVERLASLRDKMGLNFMIEIDGGVTLKNAKEVANAGADLIVAGSAIFGSEDVEATTKQFAELIKDDYDTMAESGAMPGGLEEMAGASSDPKKGGHEH
jgi:ribulose-phosphate 3-epimerase